MDSTQGCNISNVYLRVVSLLQIKRCRIGAITKAAGLWAVWKHMPQMTVAFCAGNFCAYHAHACVGMFSDALVAYRSPEAGPARPTVVFGVATEQVGAAPGALVDAWGFCVPVFTGKRRLRAAATANCKLFGCEFTAPFVVRHRH